MKLIFFPFRLLLAGLSFLVAVGSSVALAAEPYVPAQRMKVVIDNDFCGDPDGLYQLVHHLLSPSVEVRGIIGSHLTSGFGFNEGKNTAEASCDKVREVLDVMGLAGRYAVYAGSPVPMADPDTPQDSPAARFIVEEALKATPEEPLYVVCGASLTNIASAWLMNPEIGRRVILVWIGGQEYLTAGAIPPPGYSAVEYNLNLCIASARTMFNKSDLRLWQVPRNAYRQCIYSLAEMEMHVAPCGKTGAYLAGSITGIMERLGKVGLPMGEVYILGDSPLVLLTALQTGFEADPASSDYVVRQAPLIAEDGAYRYNHQGRNIRVYTRIDTRLLFEDFNAKLAMFARKAE